MKKHYVVAWLSSLWCLFYFRALHFPSPVSQPGYPGFHCLILIQTLPWFKKNLSSKPAETSVTFNLVKLVFSEEHHFA